MDERERPVERETTIIQTGERRGGGSGLIIAVVLVAILAALAFVYFSGGLRRAAEETNINVNVGSPELKLPDIDITRPSAPSEPAEPSNNSGE